MMKKKNQLPSSFWDGVRTPVAVAHRGGNAAGIKKENSLKAFQSAYDLGYRWFETDVVPTRDNILLAIHGRGFQKKANKDLPPRLKIQQMAYAEAKQKLQIGGERPLTLKKLLDTFPDVKVFIDPKTYKAAPLLADFLVSRPQDLTRVCVGSFHGRNTRSIRKHINKSGLLSQSTFGAIGTLRGLPLVLSARLSVLQPWLRTYIRLTDIKTFYLPYKIIAGPSGRKIIELAHKYGLKVAVYTPNDSQSIQGCLDSGADAVMSDNVKLLNEYINR